MKLTQDEIKQIEKVADNLDEWREGRVRLELKKISRHGQLIVMVQKQLDYVVLTLLAKMQGVGDLVKEKFAELLSQAKLVKTLDADTACFEDARLRGLARQLSETLRRIAQNAKEELSSEKPAETEQKAVSSPINIQNSNVIYGDVNQPGNLQVGDHTQIQEHTETEDKNKGIFKKLIKIIGTIIFGLFVAFLADIFANLGWTERITEFIYRIFSSK